MNKYKITIDGNNFDVTVNVTDHNKANVEVNGIAYDVVYESKNVAASTPVTRKTSAPAAPQVQVSAPQAAATSASSIKAPLPGTISAINVKVGDQVKRGDTVVVMEDGKVKTIHVNTGQSVAQDDKLIDLE